MKTFAIVSVFILIAAGCSNNQPKEITEVRNVTAAPDNVSANAAMECPADTKAAMKMPAGHAMPSGVFKWELPEGWVEQMPTPIRVANFSTATDPAVECYITVLTGSAGGVAANVNRWRQQMNQAELSDEDIKALPTLTILGMPSPYIEIEGDFTSMSGQQQPNYMMLAAICPLQENTVFVKMTGPASTVGAEKEHFKVFCNSITKGGDHSDGTTEENK